MKIQKPTLARMVIYTAYRGHTKDEVDEYAGVIVGVNKVAGRPDIVDIKTLGSLSLYCNLAVPFDATGKAGTWRYPDRVTEEIEVGG